MIGIVLVAWSSSQASAELFEDIDDARIAAKLTDQQFVDRLGISQSRLSEMRSGLDAGPGILRFASLPMAWWFAFLTRRVARFGWRLLEDYRIAEGMATLDALQVKVLELQLEIRQLFHCKCRMAKSQLASETEAERRRRA